MGDHGGKGFASLARLEERPPLVGSGFGKRGKAPSAGYLLPVCPWLSIPTSRHGGLARGRNAGLERQGAAADATAGSSPRLGREEFLDGATETDKQTDMARAAWGCVAVWVLRLAGVAAAASTWDVSPAGSDSNSETS